MKVLVIGSMLLAANGLQFGSSIAEKYPKQKLGMPEKPFAMARIFSDVYDTQCSGGYGQETGFAGRCKDWLPDGKLYPGVPTFFNGAEIELLTGYQGGTSTVQSFKEQGLQKIKAHRAGLMDLPAALSEIGAERFAGGGRMAWRKVKNLKKAIKENPRRQPVVFFGDYGQQDEAVAVSCLEEGLIHFAFIRDGFLDASSAHRERLLKKAGTSLAQDELALRKTLADYIAKGRIVYFSTYAELAKQLSQASGPFQNAIGDNFNQNEEILAWREQLTKEWADAVQEASVAEVQKNDPERKLPYTKRILEYTHNPVVANPKKRQIHGVIPCGHHPLWQLSGLLKGVSTHEDPSSEQVSGVFEEQVNRVEFFERREPGGELQLVGAMHFDGETWWEESKGYTKYYRNMGEHSLLRRFVPMRRGGLQFQDVVTEKFWRMDGIREDIPSCRVVKFVSMKDQRRAGQRRGLLIDDPLLK